MGAGNPGGPDLPACLCRSYLGTWPRPLARCSQLGRRTCRSLRCCGSGRHRGGGSGSTRPCLGRPVDVPARRGLPAGPLLPPSPSLSPSPGKVVPSQVIMGPGSKPSAQAHSKPPMTLVQVPSPQGCPTEHSSVSEVGKGVVSACREPLVPILSRLPPHRLPQTG